MRPAIIHYGNKNESRRSERSFVRVIVVAVFISVQLTGNSDDKKAKKGEKKRKKERYHNAFSLSLSHSTRTYHGVLRNTKAMIRQDVAL